MSRTTRTVSATRTLHSEIAADLEKAAGRAPQTGLARGHSTPITFYGVPKEAWRDFHRRWRQPFETLSVGERFGLAKLLLASRIEEQGHVALAVLRAGISDLTPAVFDELDLLLDDFSSWSMTDDFASGKASITWHLLQRYPNETIALLRRWVSSADLWKRRASVITFTRRVAVSGRFTDETLSFCEALQDDPEDLVQKGVGWALKDAMRAGPSAKRRVLALVRRMRRAGISSTVTLYSIRDLRGAEREAILRIGPRR